MLGLLLMIGAVAGFLLLSRQSGQSQEAEQTPTPERQVLVALQDIPRGTIVGEQMVGMQSYPVSSLHDLETELILDSEQAVGRIARSDIARSQPVLAGMLLESASGQLGGSDASLLLPEGEVAMAFRIDQLSSIAYALQPGDHIDVLVSLRLVDLDPEFQSILPNRMIVVNPDGTSEELPFGREETGPGGQQVIAIPSEPQHSRLVAQLTLQNLLVLGVGNWGDDQEQPVATPTPSKPGEAPPEPKRPTVITLALSQQDALVLKYGGRGPAENVLAPGGRRQQ
jgi:pilus assembly protein CpaB